MSLYRDVCGCYHGNPAGNNVVSDMDMLYKFPIVSPMSLIRVARIQLFVRVAVKAPDLLKNLVKDMGFLEIGWSWSVMQDLRWLSLCSDFSDKSTFTFEQWFDFVSSNSKFVNEETKKFARTRFANISPIDEVAKPCAQDGCSFECDLCELLSLTETRFSHVASILLSAAISEVG